MRSFRPAAALLFVLAMPGAGAAANTGVTLDLNRLETQGGNCRVTLVVVNGTGMAAEQLKTDLVMFGTDGVVSKRVAVELAPLAAGKTIVKVFDIPGIGCDGVGSILLNDVPTCKFAGDAKPVPSCLEALAVSSRTPTRFFK